MSDVIEANVSVHTQISEHYNKDEPHFRPENQAKVKGRLKQMRERVSGGRLLDLGCGSGFIIDLARDYFEEITGVDVTPAMIEQVNTVGHKIDLHLGPVEDLPFDDNHFDAASAYSFLDHLEYPEKMLVEASRVLKPSGELYIDLVPSEFYWSKLAEVSEAHIQEASAIVRREHRMITSNDRDVEKKYGIESAKFRAAEPGKERGGINPYAFAELAMKNGFSSCEVHFDWYLGNAKMLHDEAPGTAEIIEKYLQEIRPVSDHLFKYIWFIAKK